MQSRALTFKVSMIYFLHVNTSYTYGSVVILMHILPQDKNSVLIFHDAELFRISDVAGQGGSH